MEDNTKSISDELKNRIFLSNIINHRPDFDPFVYLSRSCMTIDKISDIEAEMKQFYGVHAFLAPLESKQHIIDNPLHFTYDNFNIQMQTYFEEDGTYVTGESFEKQNIKFEHISNDRYFEGLDLGYYEPSDRLVLYLNLHRKNNEWVNPHTEDIILKTSDFEKGWTPHNCFLSIRKSELIDYLAARRSGLLITRYSETMLTTPYTLTDLPPSFPERTTKHGKCCWHAGKDSVSQKDNLYFFSLWEVFWVDPASNPRRWDAQEIEEHKDGVHFVLDDGEKATYKQNGTDRYFKLISFDPQILKSHEAQPNNSIEMTCISCLILRYADASYLHGGLNSEGQFQSWFGLVAKLDIEKQRQIAAYSQAQKSKPPKEYIRTTINGEFPLTLSFPQILSDCLSFVNKPWKDRFNETLLLSPNLGNIPSSISIGPTSKDFDDLSNVMLELQKIIINEGNIKEIKKNLDYSSLTTDKNAYKGLRSIGYTKLLFCANRSDKNKGISYILEVINSLRISKAHDAGFEKILSNNNIPYITPRCAYLHIMSEFCLFLLEFKEHTRKVLQTEIQETANNVDLSVWDQLRLANEYFKNPN